mmetsp:Transcript_24520/g.40624  ORF Transcript_24520/g.40624 Transcript_24520/m.40624 type:complete len:276 (-) Transcript_24520:216-1043(-)
MDPSSISVAHCVPPAECPALASFLQEYRLDRFKALLEECGVQANKWFAEHARSQLTLHSGCTSYPAWVAWCGSVCPVGLGPHSAQSGETFLALWARDTPSARRAVLALQLLQVKGNVHVLLPHAMLEQLERCAKERDDVELSVLDLIAGMPTRAASWTTLPNALQPTISPPKPYECWASLLVRTGEALCRLRRQRDLESEGDVGAARQKLQEISRRLLTLDPRSTMEVAPSDRPGCFVINEMRFNGHVIGWEGPIDRFCDVDAVVRIATASCECC